MKYEGTRPSGQDKDVPVYIVSLGKDELEILTRLTHHHYQMTPRTTQNQQYHGRIRNISKILGQIWIEVVKKRTLPTKRSHKIHSSIERNLNPKKSND